MAGLSDSRHELCLSLALWNGVDPILKERMFGLTGPQGNHGEDVKDYWWYLDGAAQSRLVALAVPLSADSVSLSATDRGERAARSRDDPEFELLDTGVFDDNRYWVVDVTYAKASPTEILARITVNNRGPEEASLTVLPTLWFRNSWRFSDDGAAPALIQDEDAIVVDHPRLSGYRFEAAPTSDGALPVGLFCDNETNSARLFGSPSLSAYPKDGINDHVVAGADTVNPDRRGTKASWRYDLSVPAGGTAELRLRLHRPTSLDDPGAPWFGGYFDTVLADRQADADEFYETIAPAETSPDQMQVLRQACAGLVWSKQIYPYRVGRWLDGDPAQPAPPAGHRGGRNAGWRHLDAFDVLAMPDPWEYPWFAAWDLAFHTIPWAHLDPTFAKYQLMVLLREWFQHPNGALPAYEWNFDDVNPPVHALAAVRVFLIDGGRDYDFLERAFQKLLVNFTWWLNRQDADGNNIFGGGFLGLDNISPIDRSHLPEGLTLEQADGTAWMAYYSIAMLTMAVILAEHDPVYDDMVMKFLDQSALIADALHASGCFDHDDGFFYDRLAGTSDGRVSIKVKTLVGIIPALPAVSMPAHDIQRLERLTGRLARRLEHHGRRQILDWRVRGAAGDERLLLSIVPPDQLSRIVATLFDENEFLSPHGLRSLSKRHTSPYQVPGLAGAEIQYEPAESRTAMYGGNSNWRGPVWFPINYLVIRALLQYDQFLGPGATFEYPTGSGTKLTLSDIAADLSDRLVGIWLPGPDGRRPVNGAVEMLQTDPAWKDNLLFYEYFNGDNGAGLGAMHQTGWTAIVADLLLDPPGRHRSLIFGDRARTGDESASPSVPTLDHTS